MPHGYVRGNSDKPDPGYSRDPKHNIANTMPSGSGRAGVADSPVVPCRTDLDTNGSIGCGYGAIRGSGKSGAKGD